MAMLGAERESRPEHAQWIPPVSQKHALETLLQKIISFLTGQSVVGNLLH